MNTISYKLKLYLDEGRPDQWIIGTITNSREMKTTYTGAQSIIPILKFLYSIIFFACSNVPVKL